MELLAILLRQIWALLLNPAARRRGGIEAMMADAEQKLANHILEGVLAMQCRELDRERFECRLVWRGDLPDFVITPKLGYEQSARPEFHPRMFRRRRPSRPILPRRYRSRAQKTYRYELRRNRRWERTFIHAAAIKPATRAPRVIIPPW